MKKSFILIFIFVFTLFSCSKKDDISEAAKDEKEKISKSKFKEMKEQEAPPREIVDAADEKYSVDQVLKIDKEIPILELICNPEWDQNQLNQLSNLELTDTIHFKDFSKFDLDLKFTKSLKKLKAVKIDNSRINVESLLSLKGSQLEYINLKNTQISEDDLSKIKATLAPIQITQ